MPPSPSSAKRAGSRRLNSSRTRTPIRIRPRRRRPGHDRGLASLYARQGVPRNSTLTNGARTAISATRLSEGLHRASGRGLDEAGRDRSPGSAGRSRPRPSASGSVACRSGWRPSSSCSKSPPASSATAETVENELHELGLWGYVRDYLPDDWPVAVLQRLDLTHSPIAFPSNIAIDPLMGRTAATITPQPIPSCGTAHEDPRVSGQGLARRGAARTSRSTSS